MKHSTTLLIPVGLAELIGLNEAIVLQQIHYWISQDSNENVKDGRKWVCNTYEQWQEQFPFWCKTTISNTILKLEKKGILLSYEAKGRLKHYSIDYNAFNHFIT